MDIKLKRIVKLPLYNHGSYLTHKYFGVGTLEFSYCVGGLALYQSTLTWRRNIRCLSILGPLFRTKTPYVNTSCCTIHCFLVTEIVSGLEANPSSRVSLTLLTAVCYRFVNCPLFLYKSLCTIGERKIKGYKNPFVKRITLKINLIFVVFLVYPDNISYFKDMVTTSLSPDSTFYLEKNLAELYKSKPFKIMLNKHIRDDLFFHFLTYS